MATLKITNRAEFDEQVWQTKNNWSSREYNEWLQTSAIPSLQRIYDDFMESDDAEQERRAYAGETATTADLYVLGDIINMLTNMNVEVSYDEDNASEGNALLWDNDAKANLFYIHFHLDEVDVPDDIRETWWNGDYLRDSEWINDCTPEEIALAKEFTEHERTIGEWNENGKVDFETAINAYIEIKQGNPDTEIRFCSVCGIPMNDGYYLTDAYACSDECRNNYYKQSPYNAKDDEDAEREYLWESYELEGNGDYDISKEDWMKKPIEECRKFSDNVGDFAYYTMWY